MKTKKLYRVLLICLTVVLMLGVLGVGAVLGINSHVIQSTRDQILTTEDAALLEDVDCIIVLGCKVKSDGEPSDMLEDRLRRGVELFQAGAAPKLLMSGDHGTMTYNEVQSMKQYAMDHDIASSDIFMDHAGFSTYESIYRALDIFQADKIIIVSQEYHLYRALYIAESFSIEARGVSADYRTYSGQLKRDIREILARCKDFATCIWKPDPTYLGETIPVFGNGDITNDIPA